MLNSPIAYYLPEVERVLKICTQVQVLLYCWNITQVKTSKNTSVKKYLSKLQITLLKKLFIIYSEKLVTFKPLV